MLRTPARIAGYHLEAIRLMVDDVEQAHSRASLLSESEVSLQLVDLAGPRRPVPDQRVHELFEQQVAVRPDAIAATRGEQHWTYRELNDRANQLGRALLARDVGPEAVVAVVTERNLDWMAAVLAIFKAGCVYLPIEPHFPADRIATTLGRANCALVLTEAASSSTLDTALTSLPGITKLTIADAYDEGHSGDDLGVEVASDQLAYIYFTSGSTGEPKGAMCEHAGMLNHLFAKIDDLDISEGQVVAQTAPQCFDISLWQLISSLLVGGRTLIVEQEVILDVERWVDKIIDQRVGRSPGRAVVPGRRAVASRAATTRPARPAVRLGDRRGAEARARPALVRAEPDVLLVNAYGLTETSDDTNHEVMVQGPRQRRRTPRATDQQRARVRGRRAPGARTARRTR